MNLQIIEVFKIITILSIWKFFKKLNTLKNINFIIINYLKIVNFIKKYKKVSDNNFNNFNNKKLIFIKDGEEIVIYDLLENKLEKNIINENILDINKVKSDFVILKDNNNIVRYENFQEYLKKKNYNISNKLFLSLKILIDKKKYIINLDSPNYYVENNLLFDNDFIKWYCKINYNIYIDQCSDYYIIILDNNVKEYKLNKFNSIKILNNNFKIINNTNLINKYIK